LDGCCEEVSSKRRYYGGRKDDARKGIRESHTQRKNDESILGIVPGLKRVIPMVERLE